VIVKSIGERMIRQAGASRRTQFEALPPARDAVVFLGDSITHNGLWESWFPELRTANRGIRSETVRQVTDRLGSAIDHPAAISVLVGTNDLGGLGDTTDVAVIAVRFSNLVAQIRERAPDALVVVNSVMPRQRKYADAVERLNDHYRAVADRTGSTYLDLWPALATPERTLRPEFTLDGLHLTGVGYRAWTDVLRPHLAAFARPDLPDRHMASGSRVGVEPRQHGPGSLSQ
jgi:lysophospholipase L1-like esterase